MRSLVDVGDLLIGLGVLAFWLAVDDLMNNSVISGLKVTLFWAALSVLFLFAYPTPSFEFHTAFTGVEMGIVRGVPQTYHYFHHGFVVCSTLLLFRAIPAFVGRMLLGMPTILIVKFYNKTLQNVLFRWYQTACASQQNQQAIAPH